MDRSIQQSLSDPEVVCSAARLRPPSLSATENRFGVAQCLLPGGKFSPAIVRSWAGLRLSGPAAKPTQEEAGEYLGRRDVYLDVAALDADLERAQPLLAPNHVEQLDAWREVCPLNNLPGTDVETCSVKWTLHVAVRDDLAAGKRGEHVSAIRLSGVEAVGQMEEYDPLAAHREGLHLADLEFIRTTDGMHGHGRILRDDAPSLAVNVRQSKERLLLRCN